MKRIFLIVLVVITLCAGCAADFPTPEAETAFQDWQQCVADQICGSVPSWR